MYPGSPKKIRNILFDLGGVLLDLDFDAPFQSFHLFNRNPDMLDVRQLISSTIFTDFETGVVSPDVFRATIRDWLHNPAVTDKEIDQAWCSMLLKVPAVKVQLLQKLSLRFNLYLYSNTNAIHIEYFKKAFQKQFQIEWESLFTECFYSHIVNDRKPLVSGFEKVLKFAGIEAEETLFVDDLQVNIKAAESTGMTVVEYTPGKDLAVALCSKLL